MISGGGENPTPPPSINSGQAARKQNHNSYFAFLYLTAFSGKKFALLASADGVGKVPILPLILKRSVLLSLQCLVLPASLAGSPVESRSLHSSFALPVSRLPLKIDYLYLKSFDYLSAGKFNFYPQHF